MNKFIITGPYRSGTTYLSALLNSQQDSVCIEIDINNFIYHEDLNQRNFLINILSSKFLSLPINTPDFKNAKNSQEMKIALEMELKNFYNVNNIGFKQTMLKIGDLKKLISEGYKIIILRRNYNNIYCSWINRIDPNKTRSLFKLLDYLKSINFYNFSNDIKNHCFIVDYEELISNKNKILLNNLSDFLNFQITIPNKLYYSFNKNLKEFKNNTSYKIIKKQSKYIDNDQFLKNSKKINFLIFKYIQNFKILIRGFIKFIY